MVAVGDQKGKNRRAPASAVPVQAGHELTRQLATSSPAGLPLCAHAAFIPFNQLVAKSRPDASEDMSYLIGQTLEAKVISVRGGGRGSPWGAH